MSNADRAGTHTTCETIQQQILYCLRASEQSAFRPPGCCCRVSACEVLFKEGARGDRLRSDCVGQ
jgi:hypothetical protein